MKTLKKTRLVVFALFSVLLIAQPVMAKPLIDYSATDINWYDERGNNVCGTGGSGIGDGTIVNGEDNEKTIFFTLLANGFSKIEAAAILGNFQQESGFNPKAVEKGGTGAGRGLAQWGVNGRWKILVDGTQGSGEFYKANQKVKGKDPWALDTQLLFLFHELTHGYKKAFEHFKAAKTLLEKASVFGVEYEQFGDNGLRDKYAQDVTKEDWYKSAQEGSGGGITGSVQGAESGGGGCSSAGGASDFVDGFQIYSQYDKRWINHPYGSSTIGPSGCAPTSMAMIITNLTGKSVTPDVVADWGGRFYHAGQGSSWDIAPEGAKHWGLNAKQVSGVAGISAALRGGALVFIGGTGELPFTSKGHVIVIRAVTDDGKWLVGDPAHPKANTMKFDASSLLAKTPGYGYAISK